MKKEELIALGIEEDVAKQVLALHGKGIEKHKSQNAKIAQDLETMKEQMEAYKTQLDEANTQIQSFNEMDIEGIRKSATEWKEKHDSAVKDFESKIAAKEYEFAIKEYANQFKFTSDRVKNSIVNDLMAKEFKFEEGKLLGADDYMNQLRESEPSSFVSEDPREPTPEFSKTLGVGGPSEGPTFGFADMFAGVRPKN